jgi:hypothetical protein
MPALTVPVSKLQTDDNAVPGCRVIKAKVSFLHPTKEDAKKQRAFLIPASPLPPSSILVNTPFPSSHHVSQKKSNSAVELTNTGGGNALLGCCWAADLHAATKVHIVSTGSSLTDNTSLHTLTVLLVAIPHLKVPRLPVRNRRALVELIVARAVGGRVEVSLCAQRQQVSLHASRPPDTTYKCAPIHSKRPVNLLGLGDGRRRHVAQRAVEDLEARHRLPRQQRHAEVLAAEDAGAVHVGRHGAAADEAGHGCEVVDEAALHGVFIWLLRFSSRCESRP